MTRAAVDIYWAWDRLGVWEWTKQQRREGRVGLGLVWLRNISLRWRLPCLLLDCLGRYSSLPHSRPRYLVLVGQSK
jgi:hypothetical protein